MSRVQPVFHGASFGLPLKLSGQVVNRVYQFWHIRRGRAEVCTPYGRFEARTGDWMFHDIGVRSYRYGPGSELWSIGFSINGPLGCKLLEGPTPLVFQKSPVANLSRLFRLMRHLARPSATGLQITGDDPMPLDSLLRVQELLSACVRGIFHPLVANGWHFLEKHQIDPRMAQLLHELDVHPIGETLDRNRLAACIGVSPTHMNRLFSRYLGMTPQNYFDQRRHETVLAEIHAGNKRLKAIAFDAGFKSLQHFSSWFQRHHGLSPRAYRGNKYGNSLSSSSGQPGISKNTKCKKR